MEALRRTTTLLAAVALFAVAGCGGPNQQEFKEALDETGLAIEYRELNAGENVDWIFQGVVRGKEGERLRFFIWRTEDSSIGSGDPSPVRKANAADPNMSYIGLEDFALAVSEPLQQSDPRYGWPDELQDAFCREVSGETCSI